MAAEHNSYFGSFCPKNTISCGATDCHDLYIGMLDIPFLSASIYGWNSLARVIGERLNSKATDNLSPMT